MQFTLETLRQVVKNDFTVPNGTEPFEFALRILPNLRSTNHELRDELTYSILYELLTGNKFDTPQMAGILTLSIQELRRGIGECDTDTVFGRSFAVLIVATILIADRQAPRLSVNDVHNAIDNVIRYAFAEKDHRDFVEGKGWAHAVAHTADALGACALHPHVTHEYWLTILEAIRHLATVASPLSFEDDDRLAYPVLLLFLNDIDGTIDWQRWIIEFDFPHSPSAEDALQLVNAGRFLRSLYLLLLWECPHCTFLPVLEQQIKRLHGLYHYGVLPFAHLESS